MDVVSHEQIDRLAEDIAFVKKAIEKNTSILDRIDFRTSLRLVILLSAVSVFIICGVFQALVSHFGSFAGIPAAPKAVAFCAIALVAALLGFVKNVGVLRVARALQPDISLLRLIREYYSIRIYHHFIPIGLVLLYAITYAAATGNARLIVPMLSIGVGLIYNSFEALLRVDEFLLASYWFIVSGCIVLVFHAISALLGLSLTLGCGLLVLAAALYLPHQRKSEA